MSVRRALRRLLVPIGGGPQWDLPEREAGDRLLVLLRHGEAAGGWAEDADPGLSERGRVQAASAAEALAPMGPLEVVVSPLRRTTETAAPLARKWGVEPRVENRVGEVVAPAGSQGLQERALWLRQAMSGRWSDLGEEHLRWRDEVIGGLRAISGDAIVVTHFIAINAAVGEATGDDRVVCFAPDHCSRTVIRLRGNELQLLRLGETAITEVR